MIHRSGDRQMLAGLCRATGASEQLAEAKVAVRAIKARLSGSRVASSPSRALRNSSALSGGHPGREVSRLPDGDVVCVQVTGDGAHDYFARMEPHADVHRVLPPRWRQSARG